MAKPTRTTIQCPRCGTPVAAIVESLIDVTNDPEAKIRLLNGRTNTVQCPQCGTPSTVATPLLYHDASKELLITYMPMELGMPKDAQEKVVGDLMRQLTSQLPQEAMRGYLFQPKQALTIQGLIDQILQADGVTPEMLDEQRERGRLIQMFIQTADEQLQELIKQYDDKIDATFFRTLTLMAQHMVEQGRPDAAEQIVIIQERIAELSTFGQNFIEQARQQEETVQEVAEVIRALGQGAERKDFLNLAIQFAEDDQKLQALVGLVRPAFDYTFFQEMTLRIGQEPASQRDKLEALRSRLVELTTIIDQQAQVAVRNAATLLQAIINSPEPEKMLQANLDMIDDTFLAVLNANIQEAQRRSDAVTSTRLQEIYNITIAMLQENMQPELKFINELLGAETDEDAQQLVMERAEAYGESLLAMIDMVSDMMADRGDQETVMRLAFIRQAAEQVLE